MFEKRGVTVFRILFSGLFSIRFFSTDERINFVEQSRLFSSWRSFFFLVTFIFNLVGLDVFIVEP